MAADPEDRGSQIPDAQERWRQRGNPPSQPVSRPAAFLGWGVWIAAAVVAIVIVVAFFVLIGFVHGG
jgi:hypothetical protein